jgi:hypothetical protein
MSFRLPPSRRVRSRALHPGRYLTDGRQLLRIVSRFDDGRSVLVLAEDCRTFEAHAYAAVELRALGFRRVRMPGPGPAADLSLHESVPPQPEAKQTV